MKRSDDVSNLEFFVGMDGVSCCPSIQHPLPLSYQLLAPIALNLSYLCRFRGKFSCVPPHFNPDCGGISSGHTKT